MSRAMRSQMGATLGEVFGEESFAAGGARQALEHTRVAVRIVFVEYAYGVDDGVGLPGQFHDLGQAARAGVVAAIADHDQHFLIPAARLQFH